MKKYKNIILLIVLSFVTTILNAQGGFRKRINLPGSYGSVALASFETSPNNYLIISKTKLITGNSWDYKLDLIKYNSTNDFYTFKQIGDTNFGYPVGFNWIRNFGKQIDNYIYFTHFAKAKSNTYWSGVFLKIDYNGDTLWQKKYTENNEHVFLFQSNKSVDGGFILSGCCFDSAATISKLLIIKTDSGGNELWRKNTITRHQIMLKVEM